MKIPYIDLADQHAEIKPEILRAVEQVLNHGNFILGPEVAEFETRLAELCQSRFAVGLNSGTDALILALRALDIGPGDEVITVPNSFVASASAICLVGATPVFVDVTEDYNIDVSKIEAAITAKTKAILPVHLTGRPCRMNELMRIAKRRGLAVVEDCAQAILAEHHGKRVGSFGDVGCFSLHPLKTLNACGDGGAITTNREDLAEKIKILRNIGLKTRDNCVVWSGNSRLDTMQAAILLIKCSYLEKWTEKRINNARYYQKRLSAVKQICVPHELPHERSVYHTLVIEAETRDQLKEFLAEHDVGTSIHYPVAIHLSVAGKALDLPKGSFPVAERQADRILSLPVHQNLSEDNLSRVCDLIEEFYAR